MRFSTLIITTIFLYYVHEQQLHKYLSEYLSTEYSKNSENKSSSTDLANLNTHTTRYTCHYSKLWCGCYSKSGGCQVGCSPSTYLILYNQTSCPPRKSHFLSGFSPC